KILSESHGVLSQRCFCAKAEESVEDVSFTFTFTLMRFPTPIGELFVLGLDFHGKIREGHDQERLL
ncbi:unnamed protein product, partial [Sphenostylis stenocarpa]